jgi:hypothetical protein
MPADWLMPAAVALAAATLMLRLLRRQRQQRANWSATGGRVGLNSLPQRSAVDQWLQDGLLRAEELTREAEGRLNTKLLALNRLLFELDRRLPHGDAQPPAAGRSPLPSEQGSGDPTRLDPVEASVSRTLYRGFVPVRPTLDQDPLETASESVPGPDAPAWWARSHGLIHALDLLARGESVSEVSRRTGRPVDQLEVLRSLLADR